MEPIESGGPPQRQTLGETAEKTEDEQRLREALADAKAEAESWGESDPDDGAVAVSDQQVIIEAGENPECSECCSLLLYNSEGCKTRV